jgi:hypothetical protein
MRYLPLAFVLSCPSLAFGWGGNGHRIVALLADRHLTPQAKAEVVKLLDRATLVDVAV